jgi:glycosyltransferase involved in cell wall biosynthesis
MKGCKILIPVVVITFAYNAEETLQRAIESITNQTYRDFDYYVIDHDSTDDTYKIICDAASEDERIKVVHLQENNTLTLFDRCLFPLIEQYKDGWLVFLDSDDAYDSDFIEIMLDFVQSNNLDFATTGRRTMDWDSSELIDTTDAGTAIFCGDELSQFENISHWGFELWAKIYSISIWNEMDREFIDNYLNTSQYAGSFDFFLYLLFLQGCERAGSLSGTHHTRWFSSKRTSSPDEWIVVNALGVITRFFLATIDEKRGGHTEKTEYLLRCYHLEVALFSIKLVLGGAHPADDKIRYLYNLFCRDAMRESFDFIPEKMSAKVKYLWARRKYVILNEANRYGNATVLLQKCKQSEYRRTIAALKRTKGLAVVKITNPIYVFIRFVYKVVRKRR